MALSLYPLDEWLRDHGILHDFVDDPKGDGQSLVVSYEGDDGDDDSFYLTASWGCYVDPPQSVIIECFQNDDPVSHDEFALALVLYFAPKVSKNLEEAVVVRSVLKAFEPLKPVVIDLP